jgi:1,4-dihydroxy-2-naphthoate octaprenyltransferase
MKTVITAMRLPFVVLTPVIIFYVYAITVSRDYPVAMTDFVMVLIAALSAHIAVNMLNEYLDFKSGLDFNTVKTPFSGGSGALPADGTMATPVLVMSVMFILLTTVIGLYFIMMKGDALLAPGVLGVLIIVLYTGSINRMPWLCLVAPGTGFGLLFVNAAYFVLAGQYDMSVFVLSLVPFALVNNLLLLNQYPDITADRQVGRKHFPIAYGVINSNRAYLGFVLLVLMVIVAGSVSGMLPLFSLLALLPAAAGLYVYKGAQRYQEAIGDYPHYLAINVMMTLLVPAVMGISLLV